MTVGKWFVLVSYLFSRYISMKGREQSWPFRLPRRRGGGRLKSNGAVKKEMLD